MLIALSLHLQMAVFESAQQKAESYRFSGGEHPYLIYGCSFAHSELIQ